MFRSLGRVLMTGTTGFIGSHLSKRLIKEGFEVHCLQRSEADLNDPTQVSKVFESVQPQFLVHLASKAEPSRNLSEFPDYYENSVRPAMNLALCAPVDLKLAVFVGSCEEYGDGSVPFQESQRPEAFSPYGWAKVSTLYGVELIARQRKLSWTWLRPFLTFGPGQKSKALIPSLIHSLSAGQSVPLTGGEQTRDFLFIDDLCGMFVQILLQPEKASGKIFNLCSGIPRKIRDVASLVQKFVGKGSLEFGVIPYREREAMNFYGSNSRFKESFGAVSLTDFERALALTVGKK